MGKDAKAGYSKALLVVWYGLSENLFRFTTVVTGEDKVYFPIEKQLQYVMTRQSGFVTNAIPNVVLLTFRQMFKTMTYLKTVMFYEVLTSEFTNRETLSPTSPRSPLNPFSIPPYPTPSVDSQSLDRKTRVCSRGSSSVRLYLGTVFQLRNMAITYYPRQLR